MADITKIDIDQLEHAIQSQHGGTATFVQSIPVRETFEGQTVWEGVVHVFDLEDHSQATRAYAWASPIEGSTKRRFFAVLHNLLHASLESSSQSIRLFFDIISSAWRWFLAALIALAVHVLWASWAQNGLPIARGGAFWVLLGMLVIGRQIFRLGYFGFLEYSLYGNPAFDPDQQKPELRDWNSNEKNEVWRDTIAAQLHGPILIFTGTILWGYGDIVGNAIFSR
jgi:hypothetical protein